MLGTALRAAADARRWALRPPESRFLEDSRVSAPARCASMGLRPPPDPASRD